MKEIQRLARLYDDIDYMLNLLDQRGIDAPRTLNCYVLGDACTEDELDEDLHVLFKLVNKNVYLN